jgi:hypothetical protein
MAAVETQAEAPVPDPGACAAATSSGSSHDAERPAGSEVWLHVYDTDPVAALANRACLKRLRCPIHHVAVEVYGKEWCFQYFEDTWDDLEYSGVLRCTPKQMPNYNYQYSVCLGKSKLSEASVNDILYTSTVEWTACSYHLTRNNCIDYAEALVEKLHTPEPFPLVLKAILVSCAKRPIVDAIVDRVWQTAKWFMIRKHQAPKEETSGGRSHWILLGALAAVTGSALLFMKEMSLLSMKAALALTAGGGCCFLGIRKVAVQSQKSSD